MEGVGHPPSTPSEYPLTNSERYYPGPQQFKADNPPPPYFNENAYTRPQQQPSYNIIVVHQQPQTAVMATPIRHVRDHYLTLGVVLTIMCGLFGTWFSFLCTIPAIIFSTMARDADARGDDATATKHGRIALGLNIGAVVSWPIILAVVIITLIYAL